MVFGTGACAHPTLLVHRPRGGARALSGRASHPGTQPMGRAGEYSCCVVLCCVVLCCVVLCCVVLCCVHGGGASPQFGYATPPPLPALRAHLLPRVNSYRPYIWWRRRRPKIFCLAHVAPLPAQAVEHPNTILESNLDSNAIPTLSLLLTPHLTLVLTLTLTLIKTEYWDRAGGGGNISYDW